MPPPPDVILEALNEIISAWKDENYRKVTEKCLLISKRKKLLKDCGLTAPLQRLLLQAYLKDEKFDAIVAWAAKDENSTENVHDLVLYAQYRKQDYANVIRQAKNNESTDDDTTAAAETMEHLTAQSHFHLQHANDTLEAYSRMLTATDHDDDAKMELLTNAVAAIVSMASTPTVSLKQDENRNETISTITKQATSLLEEHNDDNEDDSFVADLASNFGLLQFLTDPTCAEENWLEVAEDLALETDDTNSDDLALNTALQWSQHFWYKDMENAQYQKTATNTTNTTLSVPQSIANLNQSLLEENLQKVPPKPHPKWNVLQIKLYWYNRAILQFKAKQLVECQESCQSLRKLITGGGGGSAAGGGGKKKKKNSNADTKQSISNDPADLWWETRVDVLLAHILSAQSKQKDALEKLTERLESLEKCPSSFIVDHAITHVSLHRYRIEKGSAKKADYQKGLLKVLKELPKTIRALPGAYYTLGDLEAVVDDDTGSPNGTSKKAPKTPREEADVLFDQGAYEEACQLYKEALPSGASNDDDAVLDSQLKFVQALAMSGQTQASQELWESLESSIDEVPATTSLPDGEALEGKTLPRSSTGAARSSLNKNLIAKGGEGDDDKDDTPSRDKILRYRARKREGYLKELEAKGYYNPDRPVQPNPERWIPKYERSRARNRNRGGNNRSAQGGVSEKDALRLDAAARKAGNVPASSGPSTANMKVSGGNRGGRRR